MESFNPSVGILGVQAPRRRLGTRTTRPFQSLGRDSGCSSDAQEWVSAIVRKFQSLGRDSGCSSQHFGFGGFASDDVSIPRSGFWVFKQLLFLCFQLRHRWFQSLGRDSGCSSSVVSPAGSRLSMFQSLGRDSGCSSWHDVSLGVCRHSRFNPSVGILGVQAR